MPLCVYTAKNPPEGPHTDILRNAGFDIAFPPANCNVFIEDQLIALLKDAHAVIAGSEPYTPRIIAALPTGSEFTPLMTCYLTDGSDAAEVARGTR